MLGALVRRMKRDKFSRAAFPPEWLPHVEKRLAFASRYDDEERARFLGQLHAFVKEKRWEGAAGLTVTDEMRVTIAGHAVRLTRNLDLSLYDDLVSIVIYPDHLKIDGKEGAVLGLAHRFGTVALSWKAVLSGGNNEHDGLNTALHEFAHVLDLRDGDFDGTPPFDRPSEAHAWARAFAPRFLELRAQPARNFLREYGATNEAEFFAVATEAFFEKPDQLKKRVPALYDEMTRFYRVSPATPSA